MKPLFNSKTIWAGILTMILPIILNYATPETLEAIGITNPWVVSFLGMVFTWLRTVTTKGLTVSK